MEKKEPTDDVSIGKFEILATYTYARALLDGLDDDEAKQRGMVAAIMGARGRVGIRKEPENFSSFVRLTSVRHTSDINANQGLTSISGGSCTAQRVNYSQALPLSSKRA